jgi:hypothetical protein
MRRSLELLAGYGATLLIVLAVTRGVAPVLAQQPLDFSIPAGAVMPFNRTTATGCPNGWTEYTALRGAYTVGLVSGGTRATLVGTALTNQENRPAGSHNHAITDPGHSHGSIPHFGLFGVGTSFVWSTWSGGFQNSASATTGITINAGGGGTSGQTGVAGTNGPYIQLLMCKKS